MHCNFVILHGNVLQNFFFSKTTYILCVYEFSSHEGISLHWYLTGLAARGHFGSCGCVHCIANISLSLATNCIFELQRYWNTKFHQWWWEWWKFSPEEIFPATCHICSNFALTNSLIKSQYLQGSWQCAPPPPPKNG